MEIQWSTYLINDLCDIIKYLKKNKLGEVLEKLADYFIKKHSKYLTIENYTMSFSDTMDITKITDAEYKLAFICELASFKKIKKDIYSCLAFMITYCIRKKFKISPKKPDYKTLFLISLLKENIANKEDIFNISYFLTSQLIEFKDDIYQNQSLILNTQNIDISMFSGKQVSEMCSILKTKRTLYVRVLLVLSYEISKIDNILELKEFIKFSNYEEFVNLVTSPLIEVLMFLTSRNILN